jgi:hypothetical protein
MALENTPSRLAILPLCLAVALSALGCGDDAATEDDGAPPPSTAAEDAGSKAPAKSDAGAAPTKQVKQKCEGPELEADLKICTRYIPALLHLHVRLAEGLPPRPKGRGFRPEFSMTAARAHWHRDQRGTTTVEYLVLMVCILGAASTHSGRASASKSSQRSRAKAVARCSFAAQEARPRGG